MQKVADFIVKGRKYILAVILILTVVCAFLMTKVDTNYDMSEYLPEDSEVVHGLEVMEDEFGLISSAQIMVKDVEYYQLGEVYNIITNTKGVTAVEFDPDSDESYKDNNALYLVTISSGDYAQETKDTIARIDDNLSDYKVNIGGSAVSADAMSESIETEMPIFIIIAMILIVIILLLISRSWLEPILFLSVSGIAILLNYGTNIIFDNVSFVTFAIAAILQLALSMDYSIMLLDQYHHEKKDSPKDEAMKKALRKSFMAISSSSLTTIFGLLAMIFMSFTIGMDLGLVLAKGIFFSVLSVFLVLPALILIFDKLLDKTKKKAINIPVKFLSKISIKGRYVITGLMLVLLVGSYFVQSNLKLDYSYDLDSPEIKEIEDTFGKSNQMILLYNNDAEKENVDKVINYLNDYAIDNKLIVNSVTDYYTTAGMELSSEEVSYMFSIDESLIKNIYAMYYKANPSEVDKGISVSNLINFVSENILTDKKYSKMFDEDTVKMLQESVVGLEQSNEILVGDNYNRMIIKVDLPTESDESEKFYNDIQKVVKSNLKDTYILGETALAYNIEDTFGNELLLITVLTVIFMIIIIAISFKSISIPILLVALIQGAIWISVSYPVITNKSLFFLAYIIAQCVQMGATIDYAILLTSNYVSSRKKNNKKESIRNALKASIMTIFTSASVLVAATFTIAAISSQDLISNICLVIGRGTIISAIVVIIVLPACLYVMDKLIEKTTYKTKFLQEKKAKNN